MVELKVVIVEKSDYKLDLRSFLEIAAVLVKVSKIEFLWGVAAVLE